MGQAKQAGAEIAGSAVQAGTIILDKRGELLVQQVPAGSDEAAGHDGLPQSRRIPRSGAAVKYGGVLARL